MSQRRQHEDFVSKHQSGSSLHARLLFKHHVGYLPLHNRDLGDQEGFRIVWISTSLDHPVPTVHHSHLGGIVLWGS